MAAKRDRTRTEAQKAKRRKGTRRGPPANPLAAELARAKFADPETSTGELVEARGGGVHRATVDRAVRRLAAASRAPALVPPEPPSASARPTPPATDPEVLRAEGDARTLTRVRACLRAVSPPALVALEGFLAAPDPDAYLARPDVAVVAAPVDVEQVLARLVEGLEADRRLATAPGARNAIAEKLVGAVKALAAVVGPRPVVEGEDQVRKRLEASRTGVLELIETTVRAEEHAAGLPS